MIIRRFQQGDLVSLDLQASQRHFYGHFTTEYHDMLIASGECFTFEKDGEVVACCGLVYPWEGRAVAWSFFSKNAGRDMLGLYKAIRDFFDKNETPRIEAFVEVDFSEGIRLLELLGFEKECLARRYLPCGSDCYIYVRIK